MKKYLKIIVFLIFQITNSQQDKLNSYEYIIYDGIDSSTMFQTNQNYLNSYRLFSRILDSINPGKKFNNSIKAGVTLFLGIPFTHEEGHRSVLTFKKIGSINQPFFNTNGAAYVKGVKDSELMNLRDNDFSYFIRLHTAGLESDYMISKKIEELLIFEEESLENVKFEFIFRKLSLIQYHLTSLIPSLFSGFNEESNELERDIVGHDIFGMVRHLHRPTLNFKRYTNFDELTSTEKRYTKKLAWKSFVNLISPKLFRKNNFNISSDLKANFSIGHSLAPFGDYFEQNVYLFYKKKYKIILYFREFSNKENDFFGGGGKLTNFEINDKITTSLGFDLWSQPKDNSFINNTKQFGGNAYIKINYKTFSNESYFIKNLGVFTEFFYKSNGFLPEYASLNSDFGARIGISFSY
jgi:hypothetical protein